MNDYHFELDFEVRDYECDLQGIVNNAVYQNYLEHTRHKFLNHVNLDFAQLHEDGIDGVVIKAELEYKFPLRPGDDFVVRLKVGKQGRLRFVFLQEVIRKADEKLMVKARITSVLTRNGRPISPEVLEDNLRKAGIEWEEV